MKTFFTPILGFVLVGSIAFGYFGWNFTHAYSEGFTTIVTQCAIALAIVGLFIGSIAHHRWKMAFSVSVTPLVEVTALAVGEGIEHNFRQNLRQYSATAF